MHAWKEKLRRLLTFAYAALTNLLLCAPIEAQERFPNPNPHACHSGTDARQGLFVPFAVNSSVPSTLPDWGLYSQVSIRQATEAWLQNRGPVLLLGRQEVTETAQNLAVDRIQAVVDLMVSGGIPIGQIWSRIAPAEVASRPDQEEGKRRQNRMVQIFVPFAGRSCAADLRKEMFDWIEANCTGGVVHRDCPMAMKTIREYF